MKKDSEKPVVEIGNATRFIDAYNKIDHSLRAQYNLKRGQSFADIIRRCASLNSIVRKFEDLLVDYARLRNAIIHSSYEDFVIAEPRTDVVEQMEKIAELICTPPLAITTACRKDLLSVQSDTSLIDVIGYIGSSGYSNLPVYENGALIGVANGQKLINVLGEQVNNKVDICQFINTTKIGDVIQKYQNDNYYVVVSAKLTIEEALNLFYTNRKLLAILITKTGNYKEPALGIITVSDIIDLNAMLDNFGTTVKV